MATAVSTNDERHASSLIVALEFYPQMAIKMIHEFPPNMVLRMIQCDPNNKFMTFLNNSEKKLIPTLSTDGFNKLGMSLLYKLIRHFNLVPEPSKKWGNKPLTTNINQGDDMERMRHNRNDLVHRPRGGLSEEERDKFFKESIEIACRVDNFIGDSTSSFETGIRNVQIHNIAQEKYRQSQEKCAELQQQLKDISGIKHVDLYYGDDIAVNLGHQDLPATDSTRCSIYIRDPNMDVTSIIEQLEQAKKRLNEASCEVKLLNAKSGSLVLHIEIHNHCFITKDSLHKVIAEFLRIVFTSISGSLNQHIMKVVLAECDSISDSFPSGTPEKKKLVDPDQLKLIKEDEGNKILWNEAEEFTKEGAQVDGLVIKEEEQDPSMLRRSNRKRSVAAWRGDAIAASAKRTFRNPHLTAGSSTSTTISGSSSINSPTVAPSVHVSTFVTGNQANRQTSTVTSPSLGMQLAPAAVGTPLTASALSAADTSSSLVNQSEWFYKLDLKCDNIDIHCVVDRRLERKYVSLNSLYKHEQYGQWFYKLDIHCIVDRRLERKYVSLNSVYKHEQYGQHLVDDDPLTMTVNQLNQSEFEQLYTIKSTVSDRTQLNLRHALVDASRQQFSILCRWLMANIHNRGVTNKEMERALDIAFKNLDKDTAKAISWCITKTFYKTFQANLSHCFDVYPGLRCQCLNKGHNTNALCSNDKLIIITAGTEVKDLPAEYKGFRIKIMDVHGKSTEKSESEALSAFLSQNYTDSYHIKVNISNSTAKKLFDSHSNLALICPSVHRSFSFARKHNVKNELCIQLYCKLKGILPLGEIHLPDSIHGIPTDVIDGDACFISKLRIGDKIGQQTSTGTLGGFVKYLGFECFLTCAHVIYDVQTLLGSSLNLDEVKAYAHTPFGVKECGKVVWKKFDHDVRSETSVDAALVWLQNSCTMDPDDYILDGASPFSALGLSSQYLDSNILERDDLCAPQATAKVVTWGAMTKLLPTDVTFPKQRDEDIVFSNEGQAAGIANGIEFQPLFLCSPGHMQSTTGHLTGKRMIRMYNQFIINLGLKPGDSGTCIYIVQNANKNGCIGMAIAFCGGLAIVTPLKDIFNRMSI